MDPMAMMQQMNDNLNQQGQNTENWSIAYIPEAIAQNMQVVNTRFLIVGVENLLYFC